MPQVHAESVMMRLTTCQERRLIQSVGKLEKLGRTRDPRIVQRRGWQVIELM